MGSYKINKIPFCLVVFWLMVFLVEKLSSKFHICTRNFASGQTIHFSDNISAMDITSQRTSCLMGFIYLTKTDFYWTVYSFKVWLESGMQPLLNDSFCRELVFSALHIILCAQCAHQQKTARCALYI